MPYAVKWDDLPEWEVLPNNFRKSVAGLKAGVNRIHWVHPTGAPPHQHDDAEQVIIMIEGRAKFVIDGEENILEAGHVCLIPAGTPHSGESVGEDAWFYEVFAPMRVQNLIGFLGKVF